VSNLSTIITLRSHFGSAATKKLEKNAALNQNRSLVLVRQVIYDALKANNYDPKKLSYKQQSAYIITEEFGVTLAILFQVLQPISKPDRIIKIAQSIAAMSYEEANYWFALITNGRSNALKAMRILFD
jgi:cytoplasmic iron level regulating protein YaaA (DUF328/UPF0246 family)